MGGGDEAGSVFCAGEDRNNDDATPAASLLAVTPSPKGPCTAKHTTIGGYQQSGVGRRASGVRRGWKYRRSVIDGFIELKSVTIEC